MVKGWCEGEGSLKTPVPISHFPRASLEVRDFPFPRTKAPHYTSDTQIAILLSAQPITWAKREEYMRQGIQAGSHQNGIGRWHA